MLDYLLGKSLSEDIGWGVQVAEHHFSPPYSHQAHGICGNYLKEDNHGATSTQLLIADVGFCESNIGACSVNDCKYGRGDLIANGNFTVR